MISEKLLHRLYKKEKLSASQISKLIHKSEGQVNYWIKKYNIGKRSISEAIYERRNPKGDPFSIPNLVRDNGVFLDEKFLYGLGLGLYWGEGTKLSKNTVRLGNSDPKLIRKFIEFLVEIFKIRKKKLKFGLQIFSDIDPDEAVDFWKKALRLKNIKFQKLVITKSGSLGTYRNKSKYGVLTVHFNNTKLRNFIFEKVNQL